MSHTSPATYLVWSIISCILFSFLVYHMWSFDRFKCLRWNNGAYTGAFKRVMTYSYLLSVPLIMTYAIGFAIIKYKEGYIAIDGVVVPKPYQLWPESERRAIFPLMLTFTLAWSLEMITHLEELCFWLFLVNSGSVQQDWFRSWYFRTWVVGSCLAIVYMPLVTILTHDDPFKCEAYTFLAGSLGSLSLTLWFTPILWAFPAFLGSLKAEGVDSATIVRLTKFSEYNTIRVCFRFIFVVPFVILGVDGVRPHTHINESMLWTDFLTMIAAFGCCISSALTLVIFFPRSIEGEIATKDAAREQRRIRLSGGMPTSTWGGPSDLRYSAYSADSEQMYSKLAYTPAGSVSSPQLAAKEYPAHEETLRLPSMRPNRRRGADIEMGGMDGMDTHTRLTENNLSTHNLSRQPTGKLNPLVHNFRSPIDLYGAAEPIPRLTYA